MNSPNTQISRNMKEMHMTLAIKREAVQYSWWYVSSNISYKLKNMIIERIL